MQFNIHFPVYSLTSHYQDQENCPTLDSTLLMDGMGKTRLAKNNFSGALSSLLILKRYPYAIPFVCCCWIYFFIIITRLRKNVILGRNHFQPHINATNCNMGSLFVLLLFFSPPLYTIKSLAALENGARQKGHVVVLLFPMRKPAQFWQNKP